MDVEILRVVVKVEADEFLSEITHFFFIQKKKMILIQGGGRGVCNSETKGLELCQSVGDHDGTSRVKRGFISTSDYVYRGMAQGS